MHLYNLVDVSFDMYLDIVPCLDYINAIVMAHDTNFSNNVDLGLQKGEETSQLFLLKTAALKSSAWLPVRVVYV
jgi:hypothetical protein